MTEEFIRADLAKMPRYRCHKVVHALQIRDMEMADAGQMKLIFEEPYGPLVVSADYVKRNKPQTGGYFVVYQDGYQSWSPAAAFEEGYTQIPG